MSNHFHSIMIGEDQYSAPRRDAMHGVSTRHGDRPWEKDIYYISGHLFLGVIFHFLAAQHYEGVSPLKHFLSLVVIY
ncbi:MAG: hypothetical protein ABI863_16710 [Ginsengibacter sp.]